MPLRSSNKLNNPSYSSKVIQSSVVHGQSTGFEYARVLRSISVHVQIAAFGGTWICSDTVEAVLLFAYQVLYIQVALNPTLGAGELE